VFQDLDATIKAVLQDPSAPVDLRGADVRFDTPDKDFAPTGTTISLFLHDVQENRVLRREAPLIDPVAGGFRSRRPPLRVDCTYLITSWSAKTGGLKTAEEHRLLGIALLWLSGFLVIDDRFLQGALNTLEPSFPVSALVAQTREGQPMGEFWTALGIAPRPAFSLTVTIGLSPPADTTLYPAVQKVRISSGTLTDPLFRGTVLDAALAPLSGAQVRVIETGAQTASGTSGGFSFPGLAYGAYTLSVHTAGLPDQQRPVDYAPESQVHNVVLPGP
jgi:Pvc16 N-terminal domain/Carboxypeptidase regulatory-like domain